MDEIYEVGRDEYVGLIGEMRIECFDMEKDHQEDTTIIKLISKKTGALITKRIIHEDGEEQYFIYELPQKNECCEPKRIRKVVLETKEEVQQFFNALNELTRGKKGD